MRFITPSAKNAYYAMLEAVRSANAHLSEAELDVKLREERDAYCLSLAAKCPHPPIQKRFTVIHS